MFTATKANLRSKRRNAENKNLFVLLSKKVSVITLKGKKFLQEKCITV